MRLREFSQNGLKINYKFMAMIKKRIWAGGLDKKKELSALFSSFAFSEDLGLFGRCPFVGRRSKGKRRSANYPVQR